MKITEVKIDKLKPAKYNPRKDLKPEDKTFKDIERAIESFGLVDPLVINKDFTVIGGHQRLKVVKKLKYKTVPCVILDLNKTREKMLNIALNKIEGDWDYALLKEILQEVDTGEYDVEDTGFDEKELEDLLVYSDDFKRGGGKFDDIVDKFEEQDEGVSKKDENWFYVEYFGDKRYFELLELFKKIGLMKKAESKHELDFEKFYKVIKEALCNSENTSQET